MLAAQIIRWLLLFVEISIALPILYLCLLSISAILTTRSRRSKHTHTDVAPAQLPNFAILIPAHNEAMILASLLSSLKELAYPKGHFMVYVVADNCTDDTAALARAMGDTGGVQVYERFDSSKRGKGYALNWLLQKLAEDRRIHDAYIVLDADSVVVPTFLQAMARAFSQGARALQANNTVLNITESPSAALRWIALSLVNHVRTLGRNGLGASSTLTGNGMCLSHDLLQRYPWQAFTIGEDYQYYLTLIEHGERVCYVPEAVVRSQMPTTFSQMRTQDVRWESPTGDGSQSTWRIAARLLRAGIRFRDPARIEATAELLTPPLSSLVCGCLLMLLAALIGFLWSPFALLATIELLLSLLLIGGLLGYIATPLYLLQPPQAVYRALLHAPGFMLWKLWVYFVLRRSKKHTSEWVRTSRSA